AQTAVDAALRLVRRLAAVAGAGGGGDGGGAPPVMFAVDDYNCLYGATDYGVLTSGTARAQRRVLHSDELILARGMRLLEAEAEELGNAVVVAASTSSTALPAPATPALRLPYAELRVPAFSEAETCNALAHYHATGYASELATHAQARQLHALTQGNARELRTHSRTRHGL
ncbi:hypothetical protein TSOC_003841, partial [Tetrabaena socialis]